jgi:hypothetical protein
VRSPTSPRLRHAVCAFSAALAVLVVGSTQPASAHEPGTTGIELAVGESSIDAVVDMPIEPLQEALGVELPADVLGLTAVRDAVVTYVADHLEVTSADGGWGETFGRLTSIRTGGIRSLRLEVVLEPPTTSWSAGDELDVSFDGLVENDDSQRVFVTALDQAGAVSLEGVLDSDRPSLTVGSATTPAGSAWTMTAEGFSHVLDGADHILFLFMLLIPAPLVATAGRWHGESPSGRRGLRKVVHVATAFTMGHSLTLAASALGWVTFSSRWVEVLIAVSVATSALHAMRPLVAHGEVAIAAAFGLVHGLAFAGILDGLELGSASLVSLAGFNLGVEAAQLAIIGLTFPSLVLLARHPLYSVVRHGAAAVALVAAVGWIVERLGMLDSPFDAVEDAAVGHLLWLVGALAAGAAVGTVRRPGPINAIDRPTWP